MMQPPARSSPSRRVDLPAVLLAGRLDLLEALRVRDDLGREQRLLDVGLQVAARRRPRRRAGQARVGAAWRTSAARQRAGEHRLGDALTGTPRSSAACTVQRPVPFCSAWSSTTSTNGLPVAASSCLSTSAVISIRYEPSRPSFQP
jgi:hypothetical protein